MTETETATDDDGEWIENGLEKLCRASFDSIPIDHSQVREYIYVGEFSLALDLLAHIQLKFGKTLSSDSLHLFDALATRMEMTEGDEWRGVAEIRKRLQHL